jgi:hypothetical protein
MFRALRSQAEVLGHSADAVVDTLVAVAELV